MKKILPYKAGIYTALGMISIQPMSGYDIKKIIQQDTSFFWPNSDGQLYLTLNYCLEDGLLTVHEEGRQRIRKIYTITDKGKQTLHEWLWQPPGQTQHRNEMVLKLFFANNTPTDILIKQIENYQHSIESKIKIFKNLRQQTHNFITNHDFFWQLCLEQGYLQAKAELDWCQHCLQKINEQQLSSY